MNHRKQWNPVQWTETHSYLLVDDKQENLPKQPVGRPPQKQQTVVHKYAAAQISHDSSEMGHACLPVPQASVHSCFFPVGSGTFQHVPRAVLAWEKPFTNISVSNIRECGVSTENRSLTFLKHSPFSKSTKMSMEVFTKFSKILHKYAAIRKCIVASICAYVTKYAVLDPVLAGFIS